MQVLFLEEMKPKINIQKDDIEAINENRICINE